MTRRVSLLVVFVAPATACYGPGAGVLVTLAGIAGWALGIAEVAAAMSYRITVRRREVARGGE